MIPAEDIDTPTWSGDVHPSVPERRLWRAVLSHAITDIRASHDPRGLRAWLGHADFARVVEYSGLAIDVDRARAALLEELVKAEARADENPGATRARAGNPAFEEVE